MTKLAKKEATKLATREELQNSVKREIERIDEKLASLGLPTVIRYNIQATISNFETPQNTINVSGVTDINWLYRALAYYNNIYNTTLETSEKLFGVAYKDIRNTQQFLIRDIISDIELRIKVVVNATTINALNQAKAKLTPFLDEDTKLLNTIKEVEELYKTLK
jgi:hypothetical protein